MPESSVTLDFCGTRMLVTATAPGWIDRMASAFAPLVQMNDCGEPPDFTLTISEPAIAAPVGGMPLTWEGTQTDGHHGRIHETERLAVLEVEGGGVVVVDHANRRASAHFAPGVYSKFFGTAAMVVVDAALAASGQQMVHAACLVHERSGRAILLSGPSGRGKTTTALALARNGFALMTDDAAVIVPDSRLPGAWGIPRAAKIHRRTAEMLSWLGPFSDEWDDAGEQGLSLDRLCDKISIAAPGPVRLGAVFELGPRADSNHRIVPMARSEMLIRLAHENVAWRPSGMVPKAVAKFRALAETIGRVPTYSLSVGPDLAALPEVLSAMLHRPMTGVGLAF